MHRLIEVSRKLRSFWGNFIGSRYMSQKYTLSFFVICVILVVFASCDNHGRQAADDVTAEPEGYHADFDIAMTLRSITDAIKVGEPLDSADYDFIGILTDGEGHPLYTDIQGNPGEWQIDVIDPTTAILKNLYLGDLLPDDLKNYLTGALEISDADIVEQEGFDNDEETEIVVYDLTGGFLRVETRAATAPNGLEGPLMRIIASKDFNG